MEQLDARREPSVLVNSTWSEEQAESIYDVREPKGQGSITEFIRNGEVNGYARPGAGTRDNRIQSHCQWYRNLY